MYSKFEDIKRFFPAINTTSGKRRLVYLDNAASTQVPDVTIKKLMYYTKNHANVHRGVYHLSVLNTEQYNNVREKVKVFINAEDSCECIFVRSTTEAINLVATSYGENFIRFGDEILLTLLEHHSNIVPWQILCKKVGATIKVLPLCSKGDLDLSNLNFFITSKTKLIAITYVSNVIGVVNDIKKIINYAHTNYNIPVLVDGAQAMAHFPVDVRDLDCDFFAFSAHKMYGPTGVGILYGKKKHLRLMQPYQGGGDMVLNVTLSKTIYKELPYKFEAGTPNIANIIAFGATLDFLNSISFYAITEHERFVLDYALNKLTSLKGLRIIGDPVNKIGVISFNLDNIHSHDVCTILDKKNIALRSGHLCAMPLMHFFKLSSIARVSFGIYTTKDDVDYLYDALLYVKKFFRM